MKPLVVEGRLSESELKKNYLKCKDKREKLRWHALWLGKRGMTAPQIADVVGRSAKSVRKWINRYNRGGAEAIRAVPNKGRSCRLNEKQLLKIEEWLQKPPSQRYGRWTGKLLREKIVEEFGISYSVDGIYYILRKRLYKLIKPRPYHPKVNREIQEKFKKKRLNQG